MSVVIIFHAMQLWLHKPLLGGNNGDISDWKLRHQLCVSQPLCEEARGSKPELKRMRREFVLCVFLHKESSTSFFFFKLCPTSYTFASSPALHTWSRWWWRSLSSTMRAFILLYIYLSLLLQCWQQVRDDFTLLGLKYYFHFTFSSDLLVYKTGWIYLHEIQVNNLICFFRTACGTCLIWVTVMHPHLFCKQGICQTYGTINELRCRKMIHIK